MTDQVATLKFALHVVGATQTLRGAERERF
jgi:hypothetical protein